MDIYLVGGAVRDTLLGLPVKDRDWVVVGASPQQMLDLGYVAVGHDFPVFLHPASKEEYALARTERSTAPGYKGFAVHAAPDVTLEQDLARRDLTINAIAVARQHLDGDGNFDPASATLHDPFHGQRDLQQCCLRHVTDAFAEDPVRILRVARFAARFASFVVAVETLALMQSMVARGEVDALVAERVWQELARGLMEDRPSRMLQVLDDCNALAHLMPELGITAGSLAGSKAQSQLDVLDRSAQLQAPLTVRFALLCQRDASPDALLQMCERLRVPNDCRDLAQLAARQGGAIDASAALEPAALVRLLEICDAFRKPARFGELLQVCAIRAQALQSGTAPVHGQQVRLQAAAVYGPQARLQAALAAALAVSTDAVAQRAIAAGLAGPQIGTAIQDARIQAVAQLPQN